MAERGLPRGQRLFAAEEAIASLARNQRTMDAHERPGVPRWPKLAVTANKPGTGEYPEAGDEPNTYWIQFVDAEFDDGDHGDRDRNTSPRQDPARAVVQNINADYIPHGTLIEVWPYEQRFWTSYRGDGLKLELFRLDADLSKGGNAAATIRQWNDGTSSWGATGDNITVHDSSRLGPGANGGFGVAMLHPVSGRYEIVALEGGETVLVPFYLDAELAQGGNAAATIRQWGGAAWAPTGAAINVFDVANSGPGAPGDLGVAWLSPDSGRYEIIELQSKTGIVLVGVYLDEDLARGGDAEGTALVWDTDHWEATGAEVTVYDEFLELGPAPQHNRVLAWLHPDSGRLDVISVRAAAGIEPVHFELKNDTSGVLARGGSATAIRLEWEPDWTAGEDEITVHDSSRLGPARYPHRGVCYFNDASERYEIITLEQEPDGPFEIDDTGGLSEGGVCDAIALVFDAGAWTTTGGASIVVYDLLNLGPAVNGARGWYKRSAVSGRNEIMSLRSEKGGFRWALATAKWEDDDPPYVPCVGALDKEGTADPDDTPFDVYLPRNAEGDPNVVANDVLGYLVDAEGDRIACTSYMDAKIGTVTQWRGEENDIRPGWRILPGSSGRAIFGVDESDEDGDFTQVMNTGGKKRHTHPDETDEETDRGHTEKTSLSVSGTVTLTGLTGAITAKSGAPSTIATSTTSLSITGSGSANTGNTSLDVALSSGGAVNTGASGTGITVALAGHTHELNLWWLEIDEGDGGPFGVFYPGPVTQTGGVVGSPPNCPVTDPTHTHTLPMSTIASRLEVKPDPHNHSMSGSTIAGLLSISPNPHGHNVTLADIYNNIELSSLSGSSGFSGSISPNPHDHEIKESKHIPPWIALYIIERFE